MSAVHPSSNPSVTNSDASAFTEGTDFPSAFVRTEAVRLLQREQEKAVALLETSPLLSYLFFTYVISAKAAPGSPVSDQNEELSALKIRSERLESELAAAQVALAEAQIVVESLRAEVQQVKSDMVGDRSRQTAILEQKEGEKEDLHRQAQKYKSESEALQKIVTNQQMEVVSTKQRFNTDRAALRTRLDELQRNFDDLSRRHENFATPVISTFEESASGGTPQSPKQPSTPLIPSQHVPPQLVLTEPTTTEPAGSPEVVPPESSTSQLPSLSDSSQTPEASSPPSKAQKLKAKRAAKKRALQEAKEQATTPAEVTIKAS